MREVDLDIIDAYDLEPKTKTEKVLGRSKRQEEDLQKFLETYYA